MAESPPSIIEVLDDQTKLARFFPGESWQAWRAFLAALFGLPLDAEGLELFRRHTGRVTAPTTAFTEAALVVGRRGGKSRVLALIVVYLALFRDYRKYLAPGERATVAVIASDRKQARSIFRYISGLFKQFKNSDKFIESETNETITLRNGVQIEIATASFRATRGYSFAAVLADETAFWRDETSANPDFEIFRALRPGMSTIPGAVLLNASSPYRRAGLLWQTYQRHYGKDDARILVWQAPTRAMNPKVDQDIINEAYEDDPESAASEYGAEFRSDIADFISRAVVEACVEVGCHERPPARLAGRKYSMFLDAAGGSGSDSMTCAIAHREKDGVPTLDAIRERKPPFSPDDVVTEFSALAKSYGITQAESDKWGGDWVVQAFGKAGIKVVPCAKPKSDIYREALPLLNAHRCSLLDHPRLITQLCGLERRTARGGRDSIDHAPMGHDDVCNAAMGVLVLTAASHGPMVISKQLLDAMSVPVPGSDGWLRRCGRGY
jgi:hypothetical protein